MERKKGQSTMEYVIVFTVIVAAIILAASQYVKPSVMGSISHVSSEMEAGVSKINFGGTSNSGGGG